MIVEWEVTLDCNYTCEYCVHSRNSALPEPIAYEKDEDKIYAFIEQLKSDYPDDELFLFGGEPFAHPKFAKIIDKLNEVDMKYIIQTNFSLPKRIESIGEIVQVSVHPNEIRDWPKYRDELIRLQHLVRRIDVMYVGQLSVLRYAELVKKIPKEKIFIVPVAGFKGVDVNKYLYQFNQMKTDGIHSKFLNLEEGDRSFNWEKQMKGEWTPKGKTCLYKDEYVLFDPQLNRYNCCYRENNDICPNDHCFIM